MKYDHFSMLPERAFQPRNGRTGMTLEGGGGGGPSTSTTYTSNIPEWLRPQTEALLGAATQEYFNTEFNPETGQYDIVGTKPYQPFSEDKSAYFAPFSRQQQDVFSEAARMQTPGGFQTGQRMTGTAGMGALGTTQQALGFGTTGAGYGGMAAGLAPEAQLYGRTAADIGTMGLRAEELGRDVGEEARQFARQAAGMGGMYERMATDPMSMQGYMSPYMQQVVERQKAAAIEDAQRANLGANLAASRQGTYGGARQAIAQGMRESALEKQLGDIQAQGLQTAFDQARQAQQFGVTTGLQGLQGAQAGLGTALQGGQLGLSGIGQAMAGQQAGLQGLGQAGQLYGQGMQGAQVGLQGVQGAQAGYGLAGQMGRQAADIGAAEQAANLARLGYQQELGGLQQAQQQQIINQAIQDYALAQEMPMQRLAGYSGLLRGYATPTTTVSQYQAAPNALQTLGAMGAAGSGIAALGSMGKKAGGVIKYAEGGITDVNALEGMAEDLSISQLQQSMQNKSLPKYIGAPILENKVNEAERAKMAQMMANNQQQGGNSIYDGLMSKADQLQGITDVPVTVAGGGMIAFEAGGVVSVKQLQDALNAVNSAQGPAKQAAQAKYDALLAKYRMQNSIASDTGAGINMEPMGGIAPAPTPKLQPQGIAAAPKQEEPPAKQGITAVAEPTLEQEMAEYQKAMAAAKGEDTYGKFLEEQAKKNVLTDTDYLLRASQGFGAAGNILAGGDVSKELGTLAAQRAADVQAQQARAEAVAKRADIGREERGEAFKTVYGKREERAKEKRTEAREIAAEKRAEKTKEKLTRLEASLRKDPDAFNRQLYKDLNSEDEATRAGAERYMAARMSPTYKKMTEKEIVQAAQMAAGGEGKWMMLKPHEKDELIRQVREGRLGMAGRTEAGDIDRNNPLLKG